MIAAAADPPEAADQFEATIVWMDEHELLPGRGYWLKLGTQTVTATVHEPKYEINVNTLEHLAAKSLALNAIGVAEIATDREIVFEPYAVEGSSPNRVLGGFILIDKLTNATVACGMLHFALRRAHNIHRQHLDVSRETHATLKGQRPAVLWFTGLSGAGKSTIANLVEEKLVARGRHTFLLDGDNVRHGLNRDLGFTEADRIENIRRVGEVARLMADAGLIVLTAFISPFRAEREMVREMVPRRRVLRDLRRYAARRGREARRQGPLRQGARGRAQELHRHRQPLRAARGARDPHRHDGDERRRSGRADRRGAARPPLKLQPSCARSSYAANEKIPYHGGSAAAGLERGFRARRQRFARAGRRGSRAPPPISGRGQFQDRAVVLVELRARHRSVQVQGARR